MFDKWVDLETKFQSFWALDFLIREINCEFTANIFFNFCEKLLYRSFGQSDKQNTIFSTVVVKDVPENATMVGIPAKAVKLENKGSFKPYGVDDKVKDEK